VSEHVVQWVTASPLWPSALADPDKTTKMRAPALLRFERDSFMDDVAKLLERDPNELVGTVATKKTYRLPSPGETEPPPLDDLKLYQAVHGHFYLVAATLSCRMPGLPEHEVNTSNKERVVFVLRRVDTDGSEWAWVDDPDATKGKSWKHLEQTKTPALDPEEELLPLFPLRYTRKERLCRLYVGLVPTSSGDSFKAAGSLSPLAGPNDGKGAPSKDPRPDALTAKVTDPLRALAANPVDPQPPADVLEAMRQSRIEASQFLLLDFAEFLHDNLGWFASDSWTPPATGTQATLWNTLVAHADSIPWRDALKTAWSKRLVLMGDAPGDLSDLQLDLHTTALTPEAIDSAVAAALPQPAPAPTGATSIQGDVADPPAVPKLDARSTSEYVIRCVYLRPECKPPHPNVISEPSEKFKIASFFDFDAPARSITITMPLDTSIKDLRKLRKNVNVLLSNELRNQMNRVTNLKDSLDGKFADGQNLDIGLLCSFSIPVITICALIVLMIFISLLNIVFWWMPFLRICFPIALESK
jgi:hypothetical protein